MLDKISQQKLFLSSSLAFNFSCCLIIENKKDDEANDKQQNQRTKAAHQNRADSACDTRAAPEIVQNVATSLTSSL